MGVSGYGQGLVRLGNQTPVHIFAKNGAAVVAKGSSGGAVVLEVATCTATSSRNLIGVACKMFLAFRRGVKNGLGLVIRRSPWCFLCLGIAVVGAPIAAVKKGKISSATKRKSIKEVFPWPVK